MKQKSNTDELKSYIGDVVGGIRTREHNFTVVDKTLGTLHMTCDSSFHYAKTHAVAIGELILESGLLQPFMLKISYCNITEIREHTSTGDVVYSLIIN